MQSFIPLYPEIQEAAWKTRHCLTPRPSLYQVGHTPKEEQMLCTTLLQCLGPLSIAAGEPNSRTRSSSRRVPLQGRASQLPWWCILATIFFKAPLQILKCISKSNNQTKQIKILLNLLCVFFQEYFASPQKSPSYKNSE